MTMLQKLLPSLLAASLVSPAALAQSYQEYVIEDFEEYNVPHGEGNFWSNGWLQNSWSEDGTLPTPGPTWEFQEEEGNKSLWLSGAWFQLALGATGTGIPSAQGTDTNPLVFSFRMYDYMTPSPDDPEALHPGTTYVELRERYSKIFAAGLASTFLPGGTGDVNRYQFRSFEGPNWINLNTERSEGWHEFKFVIFSEYVDVYVDGVIDTAGIAFGGGPLSHDRVVLGGASGSANFPVRYDDVFLANDPSYLPEIVITQQPEDAIRLYGESVTFSVTASDGVEPYSYSWTHNGSPVGGDTATLELTNLTPANGGNYQVTITDSSSASVQSRIATLFVLDEHEYIIDDADPAPMMTYTGAWTHDTATFPGFWGIGYTNGGTVEGATIDDATRTATYRPTIRETGIYDVYTWYLAGTNRPNAAQYHIIHAEGEEIISVNQRANGSQWFKIASGLPFNAGDEGHVIIANNIPAGSEGGTIMVDAVRWVKVELPSEPPAIAISRVGADVELTIAGDPETQYTVQAVDNLGDEWADLGTATTDPEGLATFPDANATEGARRFYRVIIPE